MVAVGRVLIVYNTRHTSNAIFCGSCLLCDIIREDGVHPGCDRIVRM